MVHFEVGPRSDLDLAAREYLCGCSESDDSY